jgi:hypothetical protein
MALPDAAQTEDEGFQTTQTFRFLQKTPTKTQM